MRLWLAAAIGALIPTLAVAQTAGRPVVDELFTSEGCSSCPPADAKIAELVRTRPDLLLLTFHVTYWNYLGWRDPYSFDAAPERQRRYVALGVSPKVYTPALVVDGKLYVVGSDDAAVDRALRQAALTRQTAAWDAKTTMRRAKLFEPYKLFWIEEPLHPDDYQGDAKVSRDCLQHIAAGEQEVTVAGFERLIDEGGVDIAQIDLTRCGFTQAMRIAAYAERRGRKVCNHNFTTDINTAASLHFLCAIKNALVMEYCVEPSEISQRRAKRKVIKDGYAHLPSEPGLGSSPTRP